MDTATARARSPRAAAALVLLALCGGGCTFAKGPWELRRLDLHDDPSSADWRQLDELADRQALTGTWILPLPLYLSAEMTYVPEDPESVYLTDVSVVGPLGIPVLPFWISADVTRVDREGGSGQAGLAWSLFWATSWDDGWREGDPRVDAWGLPLLYGGISVENRLGVAEWHQVAWMLGPTVGWVDGGDDENQLSSYFAVPLYLGGLGGLLWNSMGVQYNRDEISVHGPLFGLLGYAHTQQYGSDDIMDWTRTLVLGGLLWYSSETMTIDGEPESATHGPLWGMFGWGISDGEPCLRLFWLPVG